MPHSESSRSWARDGRGFPDRAFGGFAVAQQHVGAVVRGDPARVQRDADAGAESLTERSGGDVDPRQARRGMPFEVGIEPAQRQQRVAADDARFRPRGVQNRRRVSLRQHEAIVVRVLRIARVVAHLAEEQRRHDLGGRAAGARMPAACFGRRTHRIDAQARGDVHQRRNARCRFYCQMKTSERRL